MIRQTCVTSVLLWVGVLAFNLPFEWCPFQQRWIRSHSPSPSVVYIMPQASPEAVPTTSNVEQISKPSSHCCYPETESAALLGREPATGHQNGAASTTEDTSSTGHCDYQWWKHRFVNCCDCCQSQNLFVFDTDGTADDAMGLSMMLNWTNSNPRNVLAGITCVRGPVNISQAVINVLKTLRTNGMSHVPLYHGADRGLVAQPNVPSIYGDDAFGDFYCYPEIGDEKCCVEHPAVFISNLVRDNPGKVTIMCVGALTNIAIAAHIQPDFFELVKEILYLGGTESSEPNVDFDLQASASVFNYLPGFNDAPKMRIFPNPVKLPMEWRKITLGGKRTTVMNFLDHAERKMTSTIDDHWDVGAPMLACAVMDPSTIQKTQRALCNVDPANWKVTVIPDSPVNNNVVRNEMSEEKMKITLLSCL